MLDDREVEHGPGRTHACPGLLCRAVSHTCLPGRTEGLTLERLNVALTGPQRTGPCRERWEGVLAEDKPSLFFTESTKALQGEARGQGCPRRFRLIPQSRAGWGLGGGLSTKSKRRGR